MVERPTVGEFINAIIRQISMAFPDEDRKVEAEDGIVILQTVTMAVKGLVEAEFEA